MTNFDSETDLVAIGFQELQLDKDAYAGQYMRENSRFLECQERWRLSVTESVKKVNPKLQFSIGRPSCLIQEPVSRTPKLYFAVPNASEEVPKPIPDDNSLGQVFTKWNLGQTNAISCEEVLSALALANSTDVSEDTLR